MDYLTVESGQNLCSKQVSVTNQNKIENSVESDEATHARSRLFALISVPDYRDSTPCIPVTGR